MGPNVSHQCNQLKGLFSFSSLLCSLFHPQFFGPNGGVWQWWASCPNWPLRKRKSRSWHVADRRQRTKQRTLPAPIAVKQKEGWSSDMADEEEVPDRTFKMTESPFVKYPNRSVRIHFADVKWPYPSVLIESVHSPSKVTFIAFFYFDSILRRFSWRVIISNLSLYFV